jgi:hypothetical protein
MSPDNMYDISYPAIPPEYPPLQLNTILLVMPPRHQYTEFVSIGVSGTSDIRI